MHCRCPQKPEEGVGFLGAGAIGGYEPPSIDVASSGPLEEQREFLPAEPSIQPNQHDLSLLFDLGL